MIEKVNPSHPDKVADRVAGAIVDLAYQRQENPKVAVEVLLGHGYCYVIIESSVKFTHDDVQPIVDRIAGKQTLRLLSVEQDAFLAKNQSNNIKCGDNGIFKGMPLTEEQKEISKIARDIYRNYPSDGKYILSKDKLGKDKLVICQSNAESCEISSMYPKAIVNPLGNWTGGSDVDCGCTNRKLGSDMADSVTGGGLHGKDLSKADVSVNIWCFLEAQRSGEPVSACCAIGDEEINGVPYSKIVNIARNYIKELGGFEKFAEWGLF